MQAIILAAGMGKRLKELTQDNTKCMVKVNGVRLIDRVLGQLAKLGLKRTVIVTGYEGAKLRKHVGRKWEGMKIDYVDNPIYDKTNNIYSLALAADELVKDDTLLLESDLIFEDSIFTKMLADPHQNVVCVDAYKSWMDGTCVTIDEDNLIRRTALHTFYKKCAEGRGARLSRASTRSTWRGVDRRRQQSRSRSNSHSNSLQTLILQAFRAFSPTSTSTSNFNFFSAPPCAITGKNDIIYGMNLSLSRIRALPRSLASCIPARAQCPVASNHHTLTVFGLTTGI